MVKVIMKNEGKEGFISRESSNKHDTGRTEDTGLRRIKRVCRSMVRGKSEPCTKRMHNSGWLFHTHNKITAVLQMLMNNDLNEAMMAFEINISKETLKEKHSEILSNKLIALFTLLCDCPLETLQGLVLCSGQLRKTSRSALQAQYVLETFGQKFFQKVTLMGVTVPPKGFSETYGNTILSKGEESDRA